MQTLTSLLLPCLLWATSLGAQGPGYLGVVLRATEAAVVAEVVEGSAAAKVGLRPGDAMVAVDGEPTPTREAFVAAVQAHAAGQRLRVRLEVGADLFSEGAHGWQTIPSRRLLVHRPMCSCIQNHVLPLRRGQAPGIFTDIRRNS